MTRGRGLVLTGQLGDVMKESGAGGAHVGALARSPSSASTPTMLVRHEVHVHVPAGAIPKDGPSAGVDDRDRAALAGDRHPGAPRRRDDRRGHAARPRAAGRRRAREGARGAARRHPHRDAARARTCRTCARSRASWRGGSASSRSTHMDEVLDAALERHPGAARRAGARAPQRRRAVGRRRRAPRQRSREARRGARSARSAVAPCSAARPRRVRADRAHRAARAAARRSDARGARDRRRRGAAARCARGEELRGHDGCARRGRPLPLRRTRRPRTVGPPRRGRRLSDLAAMGARPLGVHARARGAAGDLAARRALAASCAALVAGRGAARCPLVGGNLTRAREISLTLDRARRGAARPRAAARAARARATACSSRGASARAALERARAERAARAARARCRASRAGAAPRAARAASGACIDVSDGLAADLAHLLAASGVGARIDPRASRCRAASPRPARGAGLDPLRLALGGRRGLRAALHAASGRPVRRGRWPAGSGVARDRDRPGRARPRACGSRAPLGRARRSRLAALLAKLPVATGASRPRRLQDAGAARRYAARARSLSAQVRRWARCVVAAVVGGSRPARALGRRRRGALGRALRRARAPAACSAIVLSRELAAQLRGACARATDRIAPRRPRARRSTSPVAAALPDETDELARSIAARCSASLRELVAHVQRTARPSVARRATDLARGVEGAQRRHTTTSRPRSAQVASGVAQQQDAARRRDAGSCSDIASAIELQRARARARRSASPPRRTRRPTRASTSRGSRSRRCASCSSAWSSAGGMVFQLEAKTRHVHQITEIITSVAHAHEPALAERLDRGGARGRGGPRLRGGGRRDPQARRERGAQRRRDRRS